MDELTSEEEPVVRKRRRKAVHKELVDRSWLPEVIIEEEDPLSILADQGDTSGILEATSKDEQIQWVQENDEDEDQWKGSEQNKKRGPKKLAQPMKTGNRHQKMPRRASHEDSDSNLISVLRDRYNEYGLQIAKTLRDINNPVTLRRVVNRINKTLLDAVAGRCSKSSPEKSSTRSMNGSKASTDFPKVILPSLYEDEEEELSDAVDPLGSYSPNQQCKVANELSTKVVRLITSHTD